MLRAIGITLIELSTTVTFYYICFENMKKVNLFAKWLDVPRRHRYIILIDEREKSFSGAF